MAQVTILGTEKVFSRDPQRQGATDRLILYRTDADPARTLFVTMPDESYSEAAAQAAIRKAESERRLATPVTFQL